METYILPVVKGGLYNLQRRYCLHPFINQTICICIWKVAVVRTENGFIVTIIVNSRWDQKKHNQTDKFASDQKASDGLVMERGCGSRVGSSTSEGIIRCLRHARGCTQRGKRKAILLHKICLPHPDL